MFEIQLGYKSFTVWYPKSNFNIPWISGYYKFQTLVTIAVVTLINIFFENRWQTGGKGHPKKLFRT
jgi:hypothetical protein